MRLALFADIHANREALAACLADAAQTNIDRYVFLGDLVGYGPDPGWVVDCVAAMMEAGAVAVRGNHDTAVYESSETMSPAAQAAIAWTRRRLDAAQMSFLRALPLTVADGDRLFVHASACVPESWIYVIGVREAYQSFQAGPYRLTFCGHTHFPAIFHIAAGMAGSPSHYVPVSGKAVPLRHPRRWLAVLGSVGQPRDKNPAACYGVFDDEHNTLMYVRVPYDAETTAGKVRAAGLPRRLADRLPLGI